MPILKVNRKFYNVNNSIKKFSIIKLLNCKSKYLGLFTLKDALRISKNVNLDLMEISRNKFFVVCKLIKAMRFKYFELKKNIKIFKKKVKFVSKEVKIGLNISDNDYKSKIEMAKKFLRLDYKIKTVTSIKGREFFKTNLINQFIVRIKSDLENYGILLNEPFIENRNLFLYFNKKKGGKKYNDYKN